MGCGCRHGNRLTNMATDLLRQTNNLPSINLGLSSKLVPFHDHILSCLSLIVRLWKELYILYLNTFEIRWLSPR